MQKWKRCLENALALTSACVGAGFATGREIMDFFSRFGRFSWAGCLMAAGMLFLLCWGASGAACKWCADDLGALCRRSQTIRAGRFSTLLYGALLAVVSGAMLAATGEACALMLPLRHARRLGMALAVAMSYLLQGRGLRPLALMGFMLVPGCAALFALLLKMPPETVAVPAVSLGKGVGALALGAFYAAFNASVSAGLLCEIGRREGKRGRLAASLLAAGLVGGLLLTGNAALLRHYDAAAREALPVVALCRALGATGYWLCAVALLLAVLSCFLCSVRSLSLMLRAAVGDAFACPLALLLAVFLAGFDFANLVGDVYPLLGALCLLSFGQILSRTVKPGSQLSNN